MATANKRTIAVIGLGTFGIKLCEELTLKGGQVIAIDNQDKYIERIKETVSQSIRMDSTDEEAMSQVPFGDVDTAVVAIGDNVEASILTTAILRKIGVPRILARSITDIHQRVLRQVGADEIINIEIDEGIRLAQKLISPEVLDSIPISDNISLAESFVPEGLRGKVLTDLDLRNRLGVTIVAIRKVILEVDEEGNTHRSEKLVFPGPNDTLEANDVLVLVGENQSIESFKGLGT